MWLLRTLVFVALLVALVFVGLKNHAPVDVNLFGWELLAVPLYFVLFGAALFGLILGLVFAVIREVQWRVVVARERRKSVDTEQELRGLRMASLDAPTSDRGPGDPRP